LLAKRPRSFRQSGPGSWLLLDHRVTAKGVGGPYGDAGKRSHVSDRVITSLIGQIRVEDRHGEYGWTEDVCVERRPLRHVVLTTKQKRSLATAETNVGL